MAAAADGHIRQLYRFFYDKLVDQIDPENGILDELGDEGLLNDSDIYDILNLKERRAQVRCLITKLERLPLLYFILFTEILKSYNPWLAVCMSQWIESQSELRAHVEQFYEVFREQLRDVDVRNGVVQKLRRDKVLRAGAIQYILDTESKEVRVSRLIHKMSRLGLSDLLCFKESLKRHYPWIAGRMEEYLNTEFFSKN